MLKLGRSGIINVIVCNNSSSVGNAIVLAFCTMINVRVITWFISHLQGLQRCGDVRLLLPFSLHLLHCL